MSVSYSALRPLTNNSIIDTKIQEHEHLIIQSYQKVISDRYINFYMLESEWIVNYM